MKKINKTNAKRAFHLQAKHTSLPFLSSTHGYIYTLEAATALLLLLLSLPALAAFEARQQEEQDFFLCYDAAGVLAKSISHGKGLQETAEQLTTLSGMCFSSDSPYQISTCPPQEAGKKIALSFPVRQAGAMQTMSLHCYRPGQKQATI